MFERLKQKYREFREWQRHPHQVKPLSEEEHDCATCGTHFTGNYCPRCGQSSTIGRYSLKRALLLFLDVWGLGNRGMFRTLRDLLLRPGYMIRDYLGGMQMAYFPPFKMFFLLAALSVVIEGGVNIHRENRLQQSAQQFEEGFKISHNGESIDEVRKQKTDEGEKVAFDFMIGLRDVVKWSNDHPTAVSLLWLLVFSGPLYLFFRRSPNYRDIRYPEFFVAMVYTTNMMSVYTIVCGLFCLGNSTQAACMLLSIIPLKQLSGYSYRRTLINIVTAFVLLIVTIVFLSVLFGIVMGYIG